jgi:ABC-type glycerol-3-phosphate transport system substrate-binding protein
VIKKTLFALIAILLLVGCTEELQLNYENKVQKETTVEEIIADKLEVENPGLDIEVDIYEEVED